MISHVGTPDADSSGSVRVMGMVTRVVFMGCVKNLCSYGRLSCWGEGCKSGEGDHKGRPYESLDRLEEGVDELLGVEGGDVVGLFAGAEVEDGDS